MRVRVVTSLREFDALAPIWREVTAAGGQTSPFLSHDWLACCWRTAGPTRRREVWVVEDAVCPLAFFPLMRWKTRMRGLPVRIVGLLDSPDAPFVDIPVAGRLDEVIATFLRSLGATRDWDLLRIPKLPLDSGSFKAVEAALPEQFRWRVAGRHSSPYLTISASWEEFFRQASSSFRKSCGDIEDRLEQAGAVSVEEHREVDPNGPVFAEMLEVSRQGWRGPNGFWRGPEALMGIMQGMPRFFRELTQRASANGWLSVWILRLDGRAVATEYHVGANGSVHALRADFDASLADLSPGAYLNLRIIRSLFERSGVHEYDMGLGATPDKLRWSTGVHETADLQAYAPTARGRLLYEIETRLLPLTQRWSGRAVPALAAHSQE